MFILKLKLLHKKTNAANNVNHFNIPFYKEIKYFFWEKMSVNNKSFRVRKQPFFWTRKSYRRETNKL